MPQAALSSGHWLKACALAVFVFLFSSLLVAQVNKGVSINKTGESPDPSAMLDVSADSAGMLVPRTDTAAILNPAEGLVIYSLNDQCFYYFRSDKWVKLLDSGVMKYSFADRDGDGYGDVFSVLYAPEVPSGFTSDSTDCEDDNALVYPGAAELCDGFDNDCDPITPDGNDETILGSPCDGIDADLCEEGVWECVGGVLTCSDNTGDNIDLCDGVDNDCDPATPDGSGEPLIGSPCDGLDTDLCEEGTWQCSGGVLICSDATDSDIDVCDGVDNDCDPSSPDGSEDPMIGTPCDGPDSDQCEEGVWQCIGGVMSCSDNTGDNEEICDGVDNDCDGQTDEGDLCGPFEECLGGTCISCCHNTGGNNCSQSTDIGFVCGDDGSDVINLSGCGAAWYEFELSECEITSDLDLEVTITLTSPPGMDYDLYLYALNCSDVIDSSVSSGSIDQVGVIINDEWPADQSTSYRVWIRLWSGEDCDNWQLQIAGN